MVKLRIIPVLILTLIACGFVACESSMTGPSDVSRRSADGREIAFIVETTTLQMDGSVETAVDTVFVSNPGA